MRHLVLALAFALLLPGCASLGGTLDAASTGAVGGVPPVFGAPTGMDQPTGGAEPNLAILPNGTLFITAVAGSQERPNALEGAAWLWRSTDNGTTWETLRAPQRDTPLGNVPMTRKPFGSSDADVAVSPDGWIYSTDWWNWGAPVTGLPVGRYGSYMVERSADGGATWQATPVTTLDTVGGIDRQWLVAGNDGFVGLFYAYFHGTQNALKGLGDPNARSEFIMSIQAVFSFDHGATWGNPVTVVEPIPGRSYQIGHPHVTPEGTLVMAYGDVGPGTDFWANPSEVRLMVSENNGTSWYPRKVADVPEGFNNLWAVQSAVDAAGGVHVAWAARTGETMTTFYSESRDKGLAWSEPVALRAEGLNFLPWVAARGDGEVAVGWYGSDADTKGDPESAPDEATWFAYVAHRPARDQPFAVGPADPEPVKTGPLCPKGASCTGNRELLDYVSLAFDGEGRLHLAYCHSREVDGVKAGLVHHVATTLA